MQRRAWRTGPAARQHDRSATTNCGGRHIIEAAPQQLGPPHVRCARSVRDRRPTFGRESSASSTVGASFESCDGSRCGPLRRSMRWTRTVTVAATCWTSCGVGGSVTGKGVQMFGPSATTPSTHAACTWQVLLDLLLQSTAFRELRLQPAHQARHHSPQEARRRPRFLLRLRTVRASARGRARRVWRRFSNQVVDTPGHPLRTTRRISESHTSGATTEQDPVRAARFRRQVEEGR